MPTMEDAAATVPKTPLLRPDQTVALHEERDRLSAMLHHPLDSRYSQEKAAAARTIQRIDKQLATQSPASFAPTKDVDRAALSKLERKLRSEITENMPPHVVMRRNPPGAVDWHRRWEKANKEKVIQWKNVRRMLDPTSDDRDLANVERYRPPGHVTGQLSDAQIQGHMALSAQAKDNFDAIDMADYTPPLSVETKGATTVYTPTFGADGTQEIVPPVTLTETKPTVCKRPGCGKSLVNRPARAVYCSEACNKLNRQDAFRAKRARLAVMDRERQAVSTPALAPAVVRPPFSLEE